jgi:hypothetical protein
MVVLPLFPLVELDLPTEAEHPFHRESSAVELLQVRLEQARYTRRAEPLLALVLPLAVASMGARLALPRGYRADGMEGCRAEPLLALVQILGRVLLRKQGEFLRCRSLVSDTRYRAIPQFHSGHHIDLSCRYEFLLAPSSECCEAGDCLVLEEHSQRSK